MPIFTVKMNTRVPVFMGIGMPIYIHVNRHRDAYIHVTTGTWDAYFWGYLYSLDTGSDRFPYLAHPLLGAYLLTTYTYKWMHLLTRVYSITVQCKTCAHWLFNKDLRQYEER